MELLPKLPYASESLVCAIDSDTSLFSTDRFGKIENGKAYPILSFMGQSLTSEHEVLQFDLTIKKTESEGEDVGSVILDEVLNTALSDYEFSVRLTNVLGYAGLFTIGDVLEYKEIDFLRIPNCGRKSLKELKEFLKERGLYLKTYGEQYPLHKRQFDIFSGKGSNDVDRPTDQNQISKSSNDASNEPDLRALMKLKEIGEDQSQPQHTANDKTVKILLGEVLEEKGTNTVPVKVGDGSGADNIFANFLSAMNKLNEREIEILRKRLGFDGKQNTLEELGEAFGITRERIRQIETKALRKLKHPARRWNQGNLWGNALEDAFAKTLSPISAHHLVMLDNRFDPKPFVHEKALSKMLTHVLKGFSVCFEVEIGNEIFFARMKQEDIQSVERGILSLLPQLEGLTMAEVNQAVKGIVPPEISELRSLLLDNALTNSIIGEVNGEQCLEVFSFKKNGLSAAVSIFKNIDNPIKNEEIVEIIERDFPGMEVRTVLNRLHEVPDVFPFSHGTWGTIDLLDLTTLEMQKVKTLASDYISQTTDDQFHGTDIHKFLKIHNTDLFHKLDGWRIAGLLKHFEIGHYLGRGVFSKTSSDASRIHIIDLVIELLNKEGPLNERELWNEIKKVRSSFKQSQIQTRPPVVRLGRGFFGLDHWKTETTDEGIFYQISDNAEKIFKGFSSNPKKDIKRKESHWTDARIDVLKRMWNDGQSANVIAKALGGTTRNAVLGKVHRLGITDREAVIVSFKKVESDDTPHWTDAEIRKLEIYANLNTELAVLARILGKDQEAIQNKLDSLADKPKSH